MKEILDLATKGLQRRNIQNVQGDKEDIYLLPLHDILDSGKTTSDHIVETFQNSNGDLEKLIRDWAY